MNYVLNFVFFSPAMIDIDDYFFLRFMLFLYKKQVINHI